VTGRASGAGRASATGHGFGSGGRGRGAARTRAGTRTRTPATRTGTPAARTRTPPARTGAAARRRPAARGRRPPTAPPRRGGPPRRGALPANRLVALLVVLSVGFAGILVRLVVLQVKDASAFQSMALGQRLRSIPLPASRGTIFDRGGRELAMSLPARAVFADPAAVRDPDRDAAVVASILGLDRAEVRSKLEPATGPDGAPVRFVYLARGVDVPTANRLQARGLAGIGFLDESRRYYPAGALAPQVLGFVGTDGTGLAGLELQYQRLLAGRAGHQVIEEDPNGSFIPQGTNENVPPVPGDDLLLTIDKDVQYRAQVQLAAAVRANKAKGGTVIVMDPGTGDVVAMATYPWFDPNHFTDASQDVMRNRAVTDVYEPGSVNKVITAAAAMEEHVLTTSQRLSVPWQLQMYDKLFHDAEPHPTERMTLADIIAYSSNIGTMMVASMLGQPRFASYLYRFGFDRKTGVGFPGEARGILAPPDRWSGTSMGTIPIGQGVAVTPLQMAAVYATVANGGVWVQPRLVRGTVDEEGRVTPAPPPRTRRVVSARTAAIVSRMLAYAVDVGTGHEAQIPGFWSAGKTGTARKPLPHALGYYTDKYMASFIGFVPAARPRLVVAAVLDEPDTVFGGIAAAPLFRDVARFALARLRVPPAPKPAAPPHAIPAG
jgi:cell division protein FtsI (penicillin-binding protein 3)